MLRDFYGNAISTASEAACEAYDTAVYHFLGGNYGAVDAFSAAITADPGFALAHAGLARARMMEGDMSSAKASIAAAQSLGNAASEREQSHIAAMTAIMSGQPAKARALTKAHVHDYPRDAMAAQLCTNVFGLIGFSGDVGREADLLAYTGALLPHYPGDWWMMSMHALSLCETGQTDASRDLMEQALELNPRNAQAAHFKAHALYEAGETGQGRAFLNDWMQGYDIRALLHGHISWHQALLALHDRDAAAMWAVVDAAVAPGGDTKALPINTVTDTAAILYRAEMAGITVDAKRWQAISAYATQYFPQPGQSFVDFHAALGHAMAGDGDALDRIVRTSKGYAGDLVRPLASAWGHIARGSWNAALSDLIPVMATHERLGGSRAQRDLIELAYVHVLMKLGLSDEAQRALSTRRPVLVTAPPLAGMV